MIKLSNGIEVLQISEIDVIDDFVILSWGQYLRMMTIDEYNTYSIITE